MHVLVGCSANITTAGNLDTKGDGKLHLKANSVVNTEHVAPASQAGVANRKCRSVSSDRRARMQLSSSQQAATGRTGLGMQHTSYLSVCHRAGQGDEYRCGEHCCNLRGRIGLRRQAKCADGKAEGLNMKYRYDTQGRRPAFTLHMIAETKHWTAHEVRWSVTAALVTVTSQAAHRQKM